ncbi:MAG: hypothetical protein R3Y33_00055 [Clostridia bacterium]
MSKYIDLDNAIEILNRCILNVENEQNAENAVKETAKMFCELLKIFLLATPTIDKNDLIAKLERK